MEWRENNNVSEEGTGGFAKGREPLSQSIIYSRVPGRKVLPWQQACLTLTSLSILSLPSSSLPLLSFLPCFLVDIFLPHLHPPHFSSVSSETSCEVETPCLHLGSNHYMSAHCRTFGPSTTVATLSTRSMTFIPVSKTSKLRGPFTG